MAFTDPIPGAAGGVNRSGILTLHNAQRLDDSPTSATGTEIASDLVGSFRKFALYLDIDSTSTPTTLEVIVQFSDDGGTTWYDYRQGLFAALFYEDTAVAGGIKQMFVGDVAGRSFRVELVAVGEHHQAVAGGVVMTFQVTPAFALKTEADRLESMLSMKTLHSNEDGSLREWEEDDFIVHLAGIGLVYTPAQLVALKVELIARGVIQ